jgi:predicted Zn-dependent protease
MEEVLAAAREAGCGAAEIFVKEGRGRQVTLEPSSQGEAPRRQLSRTRESGAALRLVDGAGRVGFAWASLGDPVDPTTLLDAALLSARLGPAAGAAWTGAPMAVPSIEPGAPAPGPDLDLVDPECMRMGDEEVMARLQDGIAEVARMGEAMVEVDRIVLAEAATTIRLASSGGMRGSYDRTLAMLSIALVPAAPEARAVVEERVSCRLSDLDPAECAREAILRALPERAATGEAAEGDGAQGAGAVGGLETGVAADLVLSPRASAALVAALAPAAYSGSLPDIRRPSALVLHDDATAAGRPSSAPFDGAGRPTVRRIVVEGGRAVGRLEAAGGHRERPSYRDVPRPAPAALVVAPGVKVADPHPGGGFATPGRDVTIRAAIVDIKPGSEWTVRIRRGELLRGGARIGPADGLAWVGDLARLVQAIVESGDDSRWYQCGVAINAPSLTLRGLHPWRRDAPTDS